MDRYRRRTRNILWELDQICQKQSVRRKAFSFQCKRRNRTAFSILWKINVHFENAPCKQRRPIQFEEKSYGKNCTGNHILWVELGIFKRESGRSWKLAWDSSRTVHFQLRAQFKTELSDFTRVDWSGYWKCNIDDISADWFSGHPIICRQNASLG